MSSPDDFKTVLARFVSTQPSKAASARMLNINRQDLYRYLRGDSSPRLQRRKQIWQSIDDLQRVEVERRAQKLSALDTQSVTQMRRMLLHLVSLIDLDLVSREGN